MIILIQKTLYRIYNFFVNIIFILLLKVFSWWQLDRMQCYYSISLRNVFPNLTHILASLSLCFLSLSPNSRRPLGVKQIVFWYLTVILPTERVRQCYWEKIRYAFRKRSSRIEVNLYTIHQYTNVLNVDVWILRTHSSSCNFKISHSIFIHFMVRNLLFKSIFSPSWFLTSWLFITTCHNILQTCISRKERRLVW